MDKDTIAQLDLLPYNTFGIHAEAESFIEVTQVSQLAQIIQTGDKIHILGGGSNILITDTVPGIVIYNRLKGIKMEREDDEFVWVEVASGEVWNDWVSYAISLNWYGLVNLALIPGTVGAAPIQNIGAYGVEVKERIEQVVYYDLENGKLCRLDNEACNFGYRDSIFKQQLSGKVFVTSVVFKLSKHFNPVLGYEALSKEIREIPPADLTARMVFETVCRIRKSKLPDPKMIGNAGSFFKNPTLSSDQFVELNDTYPGVPYYPSEAGRIKVPAGWLIEKCGWKGLREQNCGVHHLQALVLVNYGKATGRELLNLSDRIIKSVWERFGIMLEREVQIWP
jgi:UDP-N-acetylmuramate dehydrogenase